MYFWKLSKFSCLMLHFCAHFSPVYFSSCINDIEVFILIVSYTATITLPSLTYWPISSFPVLCKAVCKNVWKMHHKQHSTCSHIFMITRNKELFYIFCSLCLLNVSKRRNQVSDFLWIQLVFCIFPRYINLVMSLPFCLFLLCL